MAVGCGDRSLDFRLPLSSLTLGAPGTNQFCFFQHISLRSSGGCEIFKLFAAQRLEGIDARRALRGDV